MCKPPIKSKMKSSKVLIWEERSPEEQERRAKIREFLQMSEIKSMADIQNLFKETIAEFNPLC